MTTCEAGTITPITRNAGTITPTTREAGTITPTTRAITPIKPRGTARAAATAPRTGDPAEEESETFVWFRSKTRAQPRRNSDSPSEPFPCGAVVPR